MSTEVAFPPSQTFDVILQEVLGSPASREGVVQILADLQARLPKPKFWLPSACATFFAPIHLQLKHIEPNLEGPRGAVLAGPNHIRISRLFLEDASVFPLQAGALEFFDFSKPLDPQLLQTHTQTWTATKATTVNALATWIWAGFPFAPGRRRPSTAYPYGAPVPLEWTGRLSFSSARIAADAEVEATNWDNLVLLFKQPIEMEAGDSLEVRSWTDARQQPIRYSWIPTLKRGTQVTPLEVLSMDSRDIQYDKLS